MAGLCPVSRSLALTALGLCAALAALAAHPSPGQAPQHNVSPYPEYPPSYRGEGNVIGQNPYDGSVEVDFSKFNNPAVVDPLANPSRPLRQYRAAERSSTPQYHGRPLSESFNPAYQPDAAPPPVAAPVAAAPPPGASRMPGAVAPRDAYPALAQPAPHSTHGGLPPVPPAGGPLMPNGGAFIAPGPGGPQGPVAQTARNESPLGPPAPPGSGPDGGLTLLPAGPMVMDVRVQGNATIKPERIRPHVKCRKGRPLDKQQVEEDVKRLLATRMFVAVRPRYIDVPGGVTVLFEVVERKTLQYVKYQGSHLKDRTLAKQTGLKRGSIADPFAVEEARVKLEQFFRDRGHNKVRVTAVEGLNPEDRGAVFMIHEGPIPRVNKVTFINNTIASDARLRTQVSSKPPWFRIPGVWHGWKGYAEPEKVNADVDTLTDYYRGLGFFSARISREVELDRTQQWANLTFVIDEGPRYSLRSLSFIGQDKFTEDELKTKLKLKPGDPFDRSKMMADVAVIEEKYGAKGYVFADIEASPRFLEEPGQLDLVYRVTEGKRYRVGEINVHIEGENPHTRRLAVLNRLSIRPGDVMDIRKLRDSERRLQASGIFLHKPQEGKESKITFNPPKSDESLVENPDESNRRVRGQSPDPAPGSHYALRPQDDEPVEVIDLTFAGCLVGEDEEEAIEGSLSPQGIHVHSQTGAPWMRDRSGGDEQPEDDDSTPMLDDRWDDSRRPISAPPHGRLPYGAIVRGQSPDSESSRSGNSLSWRPPSAPESAGASTTQASTAARPTIRAQGDVGYQPGGGQAMPSWNTQSQPAGAPAGSPLRQVQQTYSPTTSLPPARQVINRDGTPIQSRYVDPADVSPPGGFAPYGSGVPSSAQAPSANAYGQFTPAPAGAPNNLPSNAPSWSTPSPQPGYPPAAAPGFAPAPSAVPPPAAAPGVLPPPSGYDSPAQVFGSGEPAPGEFLGPGQRDWIEQDPALPLEVFVTETQTGRLMLGVGVNSNAGLVGSAVIDEQNFDWTRVPRSWQDVVNGTAFRGAGQHFRMEAMPGTQFQRYLISFTEPYLFDTPVLFGLNGSYFVRMYPNWTEQRLGGRVNLGYQLAPDLTIGGALRAESINISNPTVPSPQQLTDVLGNNALYTARANIVQDTRDSAFMPTQGRRISLAFEQGFGDFSYPRGELEASQYFTIRQRADGSGRHVIRLGGQFGISGSDTPIFENFFAGGYSTIRGFRFRGASPVDMNVIVGGRLMMLAGAEYMFPITADDMLRGVVFCDTGTVEQDIHITSSDYRVAIGAGLRISVPMMGPAPIALDFAVPLAKADTDLTQVLSFFVGVQY